MLRSRDIESGFTTEQGNRPVSHVQFAGGSGTAGGLLNAGLFPEKILQPLIDEDTLHIHLISASEEYQSEPSLKDLKKKLEESDDRIKVTASWGEDEGEDLPDIELLEEAASSNR